MLLSLNMQFQKIHANCHSHQKCQQLTWAQPSMMPYTLPYQAQICVASRIAAYNVSCNTGCIRQCDENNSADARRVMYVTARSRMPAPISQSSEASSTPIEVMSCLWCILVLHFMTMHVIVLTACAHLVCSCRGWGAWSEGWMVCQPPSCKEVKV